MNLNATQGSPYQGLTQTRPYDFGTDAIERQRVSLGQAMMDADFEYGLQATKWQSFYDVRKTPTFFEIPGTDATLSNVVSDGTYPYSNITVFYSNAISQPQVVGGAISIFGLSNPTKNADRAEGYYIITSNNATANTANYISKGWVPAGNVQTNLTFSKRVGIYNNASMNIQFSNLWTDGSSNIQVWTSNAHGVLPGTPMTLQTSYVAATAPGWTANGTYLVCNVTSSNTFNIVSNALTFTAAKQATPVNTQLFVNPFGSTQHRPYDGGVLLSTLAPAHGSTVLRQSKKAFRYQSGKGILFSSGTLFCPNLDVASMNLYGLTTSLATNSNGLTGVPLTVSQPALLGLNQNVTFSTGQSSFLNSNVSSISGSNVSFIYAGTFPGSTPATVTQNVVTTTAATISSTIAVQMANTSGFSTGPATFSGLGTLTITSVVGSSLNVGPYPYAPIPAGTRVTQGTASNVTSASTSFVPLNLQVASTNGFVLGETVTLNPAVAALGTLTVASNASTTLGLAYTGLANSVSTPITQYTTVSGSPVTITGPAPFTANITGSQIFSPGQVVASYLGLNLGNVTVVGTTTQTAVANGNTVTLSYTGSFPPNGIPTGTVITTLPPGSNIQIVTDLIHGIPTTGASVTIRNVGSSNINGSGYTITGVSDSHTVNVQSQSTITTTAINYGDQPRLVVNGWHGASVRAGIFEDPNGMFWEYDGQTLYVVRRQSTFQCAGYVTTSPGSQTLIGSNSIVTGSITTAAVAVNPGDTTAILTAPSHTVLQSMYSTVPGLGTVWVIGAPDFFQVQIGFLPAQTSVNISGSTTVNFVLPTTRFQDQLKVNDRFTIRGMTHQVTSIQGQGVLTFNPPYRGASIIDPAHAVKACKIKELRIPQSQFNRDTMDGKGPSGYKVDLTRMQMIGIQYTWYGAGFIDYMMRGPDGNWIYAHRIRNNNVNDEAYMRSGNLPVRYELTVETRAAVTSLAAPVSNLLGTSSTMDTITVSDPTTYFPPSGTLLIDSELINYSNLAPYGFFGLTRAYPLTYIVNDAPRTFTGSANTSHQTGTSVNLVSCSATPTLTHWGSSFLTDGQFDVERGYYFNYSNVTVNLNAYGGGTNPAAGSNACAFAIRLAPSVTNGLVGDVGQKELLNRAQLLLQKLEVTSPVNVQTVGFLNPTGVQFLSNNWVNVNTPLNGTQPSFVQYYPGNLISGVPQPGERIFSTIVQANNQNNLDLSALKEMSNSVIGGNQNFPDGPDTLVIFCQNLSTSGGSNVVQVNLFWSEAQA